MSILAALESLSLGSSFRALWGSAFCPVCPFCDYKKLSGRFGGIAAAYYRDPKSTVMAASGATDRIRVHVSVCVKRSGPSIDDERPLVVCGELLDLTEKITPRQRSCEITVSFPLYSDSVTHDIVGDRKRATVNDCPSA